MSDMVYRVFALEEMLLIARPDVMRDYTTHICSNCLESIKLCSKDLNGDWIDISYKFIGDLCYYKYYRTAIVCLCSIINAYLNGCPGNTAVGLYMCFCLFSSCFKHIHHGIAEEEYEVFDYDGHELELLLEHHDFPRSSADVLIDHPKLVASNTSSFDKDFSSMLIANITNGVTREFESFIDPIFEETIERIESRRRKKHSQEKNLIKIEENKDSAKKSTHNSNTAVGPEQTFSNGSVETKRMETESNAKTESETGKNNVGEDYLEEHKKQHLFHINNAEKATIANVIDLTSATEETKIFTITRGTKEKTSSPSSSTCFDSLLKNGWETLHLHANKRGIAIIDDDKRRKVPVTIPLLLELGNVLRNCLLKLCRLYKTDPMG